MRDVASGGFVARTEDGLTEALPDQPGTALHTHTPQNMVQALQGVAIPTGTKDQPLPRVLALPAGTRLEAASAEDYRCGGCCLLCSIAFRPAHPLQVPHTRPPKHLPHTPLPGLTAPACGRNKTAALVRLAMRLNRVLLMPEPECNGTNWIRNDGNQKLGPPDVLVDPATNKTHTRLRFGEVTDIGKVGGLWVGLSLCRAVPPRPPGLGF